MTTPNWNAFYGHTKDSPPWPLLIRAADLAPAPRRALDLGAGAGRDTRYLLEHGFSVTAVDAEPGAVALLAALPQERLRVVRSTFQDFTFATYDLINAEFSLPFVPPEHFADVIARLKAALAPGGIFAGQFFGLHDEFNDAGHPMSFVSRTDAEAYLDGLETLEFTEEDEDGHKADGTAKHWHVFHILARNPLAQPGDLGD